MQFATTLFGEDAPILRDRSFQLLLLANLTPALGNALVSPLLDTLVGPLGTSEAEIGLLLTMFTAPSIFFIPLAGMLADRIGRKYVLIGGLLLFGAGGMGIAFTTDFRVVLGLRLLQGAGFAGLTPIIVTSLGDLYYGSKEATAQGIRFSTSGLSMMTFPFVAGILVTIAWQFPFLLYGLTVPTALLLFVSFKEPMGMELTRSESMTDFRTLACFVSNPRVAAVLAGRSVPNFLYTAFLTYNSFVVVRVIGGNPSEAGLLITAASLIHAVSATQAGRITDMFGMRLYPLLGATLSMAGGLTLVGLAPSLPVALVGGGGVGLGFGLSLSLYRSAITDLTTEATRGSVVSVGASLGRISSTVAPIAMGFAVSVADPMFGFDTAVRGIVAAAGLLCGAVGVVCLLVANRSPEVRSGGANPT